MDHLDRYRRIIPDYPLFCEAMIQPLPVCVRINSLKTSADDLMSRLDRARLSYRRLGWYRCGLRLDGIRPGLLIEHLMGHIHPQEESSMIPPLVLDPQPGEKVLDLCASPGSKTTQIAQMMENDGLLVANDPSPGRIVALRANCERLGAANVVVTRCDGRAFPRYEFDRVLVDAPCSGEGMARKDLSVLKRCNLKRSLGLQRLQQALLGRAVDLTRRGGVIVYSTCTYAPEENEAVVESVLDRVRLIDVDIPGLARSHGLDAWDGNEFGDSMGLCARYYPHHNDTGGFFVAKLIKR